MVTLGMSTHSSRMGAMDSVHYVSECNWRKSRKSMRVQQHHWRVGLRAESTRSPSSWKELLLQWARMESELEGQKSCETLEQISMQVEIALGAKLNPVHLSHFFLPHISSLPSLSTFFFMLNVNRWNKTTSPLYQRWVHVAHILQRTKEHFIFSVPPVPLSSFSHSHLPACPEGDTVHGSKITL